MDTRQGKDLTGTLISDIVLQLLSYVAQTEREFIKQRQAEGIAAAKARSVKFGRRPIPKPEYFDRYVSEWKKGSILAREAAKQMNVSHKIFLRWTKNMDI